MYPMVLVLFLAIFAALDRLIFWLSISKSIDESAQEKCRDLLSQGKLNDILSYGKNHPDPFVLNLAEGITHEKSSMLAAMQLHASKLLAKAEARQWLLSTIITLAPLLGLLGTVSGIMGSFQFVGNEDLAAQKVSGGIAEALIATACGLGIAILCLIPYNFYRKKISTLRHELENWINHCELLKK